MERPFYYYIYKEISCPVLCSFNFNVRRVKSNADVLFKRVITHKVLQFVPVAKHLTCVLIGENLFRKQELLIYECSD